LYSRMSQAISMLPSLNGYGVSATPAETKQNATRAFITNGLGTVLKINNICTYNELAKCGIVSEYKNMGGVKKDFPTTLDTLNTYLAGSSAYSHSTLATAHDSYSLPDINAAAFETANGESVAVFYQPYCHDNLFKDSKDTSLSIFSEPFMCANFIYDLNGKKGPNQAGKDIGFITAFYPTDSEVVMPEPLSKDSSDENGNYTFTKANALRICGRTGQNVRTPSREELSAIAINAKLSAILTDGTEYIMKDGGIFVGSSIRWLYGITYSPRVRCVKK